jgi:hypothetical protein
MIHDGLLPDTIGGTIAVNLKQSRDSRIDMDLLAGIDKFMATSNDAWTP